MGTCISGHTTRARARSSAFVCVCPSSWLTRPFYCDVVFSSAEFVQCRPLDLRRLHCATSIHRLRLLLTRLIFAPRSVAESAARLVDPSLLLRLLLIVAVVPPRHRSFPLSHHRYHPPLVGESLTCQSPKLLTRASPRTPPQRTRRTRQ